MNEGSGMSVTVELSCECGSVKGQATVSPKSGTRIVCECRDCQTFAQFLGRTERILDRHGGTDIFQLTPSQVTIAQGRERIKCIRLSERGMIRFYADCCKTPIANTLGSAKIAFMGLIHSFTNHGSRDRDLDIGPVRTRGNIQNLQNLSAKEAEVANRYLPFLGTLGMMLMGWVRAKHAPSPLFDLSTGKPISTPRILSPEERAKLRAQTIGPIDPTKKGES